VIPLGTSLAIISRVPLCWVRCTVHFQYALDVREGRQVRVRGSDGGKMPRSQSWFMVRERVHRSCGTVDVAPKEKFLQCHECLVIMLAAQAAPSYREHLKLASEGRNRSEIGLTMTLVPYLVYGRRTPESSTFDTFSTCLELSYSDIHEVVADCNASYCWRNSLTMPCIPWTAVHSPRFSDSAPLAHHLLHVVCPSMSQVNQVS
jgi:hypothetical protein